jgi:hypothetical protein
MTRTRLQRTNRVVDYGALRPGMDPYLETIVCFHQIFETGDKALLCLFAIACQEERQLVQTIQAVGKELLKVVDRRVYIWPMFADSLLSKAGHLFAS